jgi:YD repeat-containing protein
MGASGQFTVPPGATRLFLGVLDLCDWANNSGSFTVVLEGNSASTLTVNATPGGAASASSYSGYVGSTITLNATPANGYAFGYWLVNDWGGGKLENALSPATKFTLGTGNAVVTAKFITAATKTGDIIGDILGGLPSNPLSLIAEPIDTATGAHVMHESLLTVHGAQALEFSIDYNSLGRSNDIIGSGWSHNFEAAVSTWTNGSLNLRWTANRANIFLPSPTNASVFTCPDLPVIYDTLTANADGTYTLAEPSQRHLLFDSAGRLQQVINPHGQAIALNYPPNSRYPTQLVETVSGNYLNLTYYTNNHLSQISDASGRFVSFYYTSNQLISWTKTDSTGNNYNSFTYDGSGRILSRVNNEGYMVFTNTYDSQGRVGIQRDWRGNPTTLYYDESDTNALVTTVVDRLGNTNIYIHDSRYQLVSVTDPMLHTIRYGYDTFGNRTAVTNALLRFQLQSYDLAGNLLSSTDEGSNTTWYKYDDRNNLKAVTNAIKSVATFSYDARNNCTNATDFGTNWVLMFYDSNSQLTNILTQRGGRTSFFYNAGLLASITDANTNTTRFGYDLVGRVIAVTNGGGYATTNSYDLNDYLASATDALSNTWHYNHDSAGRVTRIIDPLGHNSGGWYDGNGNLQGHYDSLWNCTFYYYDAEDHLTNSTDANNHSTFYSYDPAGRLAYVADALNHTNSVHCDAVGNLTFTVNALGITNQITAYDERNNPTNISDALGHERSMVYDQLKRITQTIDSLNRTNGFGFDSMSRLLASTDPLSLVTRQQFDSDGNRTIVTNPKSLFENDNKISVTITCTLCRN